MKDQKTEWKRLRTAVCVAFLAATSGCAAIATRIIHSEPFAGVKTDYGMCFHRDGISPECRINPVFAVIDVPFSLVVDLCFLPFEIGHHAGHSLWNPPAIQEHQETSQTNIPNEASQAIGAAAPQPER